MVKCCRRKIRECDAGLSVKTALNVLSKPNLRAAKILVYINVAAGHSHFSGHRHRSHNPYSLQKLSVRQSLRPLKKEASAEDINLFLCSLPSSNNSGGFWRGTQHLVYFYELELSSTRLFLKIILQSYSIKQRGPCLFCWGDLGCAG